MLNTTAQYILPSPQQGTDFNMNMINISSDIEVVSNTATMFVLYQGPAPQATLRSFRWIPVGQSWEDTTSTEYVNLVKVCDFNFGNYVLCTVQKLS